MEAHQFCSDRPKTSDLGVSGHTLLGAGWPLSKNIQGKKFFFILGFGLVFLPLAPHKETGVDRQTTDLRS